MFDPVLYYCIRSGIRYLISIGFSFYKLRFAAAKTEDWTITEDKTSNVSGVTSDGV